MPMKYKTDVLSELKNKGFSTYKIRKEKIFGEGTLQNFRLGLPIDWKVIEKLCALLECQPGDILEFVPDSSDETNEQ